MTPRYLWLLHYDYGGCIVIKLTDEEIAESESEKYNDDFEVFISECLEEKYNFRLKDCCWMATEEYNYEKYGF